MKDIPEAALPIPLDASGVLSHHIRAGGSQSMPASGEMNRKQCKTENLLSIFHKISRNNISKTAKMQMPYCQKRK